MPSNFGVSDVLELAPDLTRLIASAGSEYPPDYQQISPKSTFVLNNLPVFEGKRVVDIGSNFGIYTMLISRYAHSVVGMERSPKIFDAANLVLNYLKGRGFSLENVTFRNQSAEYIKELDVNAALISLVLYHLQDSIIDEIFNFLTHRCETVVLQARPARYKAFQKGLLTDHVSVNTKYNGLFDLDDNLQLVHDCGFKKIRIDVNPELYYGEVFPVIVASK